MDDQNSISFCFVGSGEFGAKIGRKLSNPITDFSKSKCLNIMYDPNKINFDAHPDNDHLIFLAGSALDKQFWKTREFILSKHPKFLISICSPETGFNIEKLKLSNNECWVNLPEDNPIHIAGNVINDVYSSLSSPGPINLDLDDIRYALSKGTGFGISLESHENNAVPELKHFIVSHLNTIKKYSNLILLFSFNPGVNPDLDYQTDLSETVYKSIGEDIGILWCSMNHRELNCKFRVTIIGS